MKHFIIFLFSILLFSCQEKSTKYEFYSKLLNDEKLPILNLDTVNTFGDFYDVVIAPCTQDKKVFKDNGLTWDSYLLVKSDKNGLEFPVNVSYSCIEKKGLTGCRKSFRNQVNISDSSVFNKNDITNYMLNNGRERNFSDAPQKATIILSYTESFPTDKMIKDVKIIQEAYFDCWSFLAKKSNIDELNNEELKRSYKILPIKIFIDTKDSKRYYSGRRDISFMCSPDF
ncbi:hypothetical protein [Flammeovirga sp. SJP92]|uniref:hypothetical protein n=1 Tax=Flammeovirga sp. SJP92 TaxID=1775430 RepID=UPI0012FB2C6F|nr:hypothetical protein [Flammeovirga sp. SJP92]